MAWVISHVPACVHKTQGLESTDEYNGEKVGRTGVREKEKGGKVADTCMCLNSFISSGCL